MVLVVKNLSANAGDVRHMDLIPGLGRSLEKEMATHSTILAWKIPWAEELGRLQFTVLQSRTQLSMHTHTHTHTHTYTHTVIVQF